MTALKKFSRLEAKAVWIENANSPPKSVIISFGKSSIIISDKNAFPLDHWNFNSIIVISKDEEKTIFSQELNKIEQLIIDDKEMINAIILICNLKAQINKKESRLTKPIKYFVICLSLILLFFFPKILRQIIVEITEPHYELIYYYENFNKFKKNNEICNNNKNIYDLEKKLNNFFQEKDFLDIIVIKNGWTKPMLFPGGKIIVPFNWLQNQKQASNFKQIIQVANYSYKQRIIFKYFLKNQKLITILSFLFGLNPIFEMNFNNYIWENFVQTNSNNMKINITSDEWINLKNLCFN